MEAIGGIASVTGVVGFIGQIAGGCKVVKEIIGDIKNAPKDIIRLAECIKSIEESSNEVLRQHEQLKTHYGIQDIPAAGAHMLEAIKAAENKLSSSAEIFGNSTMGSKNKRKQFWHRLKYAANKEEIKELMQWVDSTTQQVTLVQQNLSRIIQLEQSDLLKEISTNIIEVPHAIHDSRDAIITAQQNQTETLRSEMQKSQSHLVQMMSTTIATKALEDVREDLLLSLKGAMEECIQAQRLDVGPQVQFLVGKCLQRDLPIHSAKLAEQRGNDVSVSLSSPSPRSVTPTSYHASSTPDKMKRRKKGKKLILSTWYNYRFLGINVSIAISSYANNQYQFSRSSSGPHDLSSTSVSIFLTIPWARRGLDLRYEMPSVPYSRESFISLRPYYIHAKGSEFHKAVTEFDIETARNLFEQGRASPLDEVEGLNGLLKILYLFKRNYDNSLHIEWVKFILGYQVDRYIDTKDLKHFIFLASRGGNDPVYEALTLILECSQDCFLQDPDIKFSLWRIDRPPPEHSRIIMPLRNYDQLIDWDCHEFPSHPGLYLENSRQLFENPQGDGLDDALDRGCQYRLISDQEWQGTILGNLENESSVVSILEFINRYSGSRSREEVIYCCSNRLEILIVKGLNLNRDDTFRTQASLLNLNVAVYYYSTVNYVIQTGAWKHLFEMLVQIGWNERKIQELYDEEIFLGIPALMEGLQYRTIENAREEFLQRLLNGDDYSCFDTKKLSVELASKESYISEAITRASLQCSEKMNIPGSWEEEEVAVESISEKDIIMPWCLSIYSWTSSHHYTCIHYGQYHTKCHVPRKEWNPYNAQIQLVDMVEDMESKEDMESNEDSD
ncbi:uncharacterized protein EAF02_007300 [Botrytis sinoallii]|uniref:uncharacterized protein n=1 Tax=Botrytis sinoallii TaxID=1463999 RepID=UPI001900D145|nr:uncharacterized protein EAF02_007300 [Botrytis sinoallii]KAF7880454.1 hypothetical protein EAF02_007300 [Botrytis sinoallii]